MCRKSLERGGCFDRRFETERSVFGVSDPHLRLVMTTSLDKALCSHSINFLLLKSLHAKPLIHSRIGNSPGIW